MTDVDLTGAFLLSQAIGKRSMIPAKWGRIVNVASIAGLMGQDPRIVRTIAYNASKGGLVNFTRALAAEWGAYGITVNAICPGYTATPMLERTVGMLVGKTGRSEADARKFLADVNTDGRIVEPEEVAAIVLRLCAEGSEKTTGQAIPLPERWGETAYA